MDGITGRRTELTKFFWGSEGRHDQITKFSKFLNSEGKLDGINGINGILDGINMINKMGVL